VRLGSGCVTVTKAGATKACLGAMLGLGRGVAGNADATIDMDGLDGGVAGGGICCCCCKISQVDTTTGTEETGMGG
jgi:hypothetical protein